MCKRFLVQRRVLGMFDEDEEWEDHGEFDTEQEAISEQKYLDDYVPHSVTRSLGLSMEARVLNMGSVVSQS